MVKYWAIEYWNVKAKQVEYFTCNNSVWTNLPLDNVIFVHVWCCGIRPYGNPSKLYRQTHDGLDYYFLQEFGDGIC